MRHFKELTEPRRNKTTLGQL